MITRLQAGDLTVELAPEVRGSIAAFFAGRDGHAEVSWPQSRAALSFWAEAPLNDAVLFTPRPVQTRTGARLDSKDCFKTACCYKSGSHRPCRMTVEHDAPLANAAAFDTRADDVFGRIAGRYDLLCDLFSLGLHRWWKRRVAQRIAQEPWNTLLDAASGTGDVALRVVRHQALRPGQTLIVSDISPQMLAVARRRAGRLSGSLAFRLLDAQAMPSVADGSIDLYAMSLGLKLCDRTQVLREALRVLRPGGRFIALETSRIVWPWLHRAYLAYMRLCIPVIGWIATGGDASAYRYLLQGIQDIPGAESLASELAAAGFCDVSFERLTFGIVAIHVARKPQGVASALSPAAPQCPGA